MDISAEINDTVFVEHFTIFEGHSLISFGPHIGRGRWVVINSSVFSEKKNWAQKYLHKVSWEIKPTDNAWHRVSLQLMKATIIIIIILTTTDDLNKTSASGGLSKFLILSSTILMQLAERCWKINRTFYCINISWFISLSYIWCTCYKQNTMELSIPWETRVTILLMIIWRKDGGKLSLKLNDWIMEINTKIFYCLKYLCLNMYHTVFLFFSHVCPTLL